MYIHNYWATDIVSFNLIASTHKVYRLEKSQGINWIPPPNPLHVQQFCKINSKQNVTSIIRLKLLKH